MKEIVLASASPRRCELLKQIGLEFRVCPSDIEETVDTALNPEDMAVGLSYRKAKSVAEGLDEDALVIGADTIVVGDRVLGKPVDEQQAYEMLMQLQGSWHEVITGVTVIDCRTLKTARAYEKTAVKMRSLTDSLIRAYIKTGEPMDKAGSYGIQGMGALLVEKIVGCYFNVVGLPLAKLAFMLEDFEVKLL